MVFDIDKFKEQISESNLELIEEHITLFKIKNIANQMVRDKLIERLPNKEELQEILTYVWQNRDSDFTLIIEGIQSACPCKDYV